MREDVRAAALRLQQALMADCRLCLKDGMPVREWIKRVRLLMMYSVPPEAVTHAQDEKGEWWHWLNEPNKDAEGGA